MTTALTKIAFATAIALGVAGAGFSSSPAEASWRKLHTTSQFKLNNRASDVMLNPQPLPPGPCKVCGVSRFNLNRQVLTR